MCVCVTDVHCACDSILPSSSPQIAYLFKPDSRHEFVIWDAFIYTSLSFLRPLSWLVLLTSLRHNYYRRWYVWLLPVTSIVDISDENTKTTTPFVQKSTHSWAILIYLFIDLAISISILIKFILDSAMNDWNDEVIIFTCSFFSPKTSQSFC